MMAAKQVKSKGTGPHVPKKIKAPQILDQSGGDLVSGPDQLDKKTQKTE